jgi:ABC-2 type transport system ATP-binding protein
MSMPLIELKKASKTYLDQSFDLTVEEGKCLLISGRNGAGKSSLIHLMIGFTKPDFGIVLRKKTKIGYLPEELMLPLFVNTMTYLKTIARIKRGKIDEMLISNFKIPIFKSIIELSKGNRQKLALASTFIGNPKIIILDEPLTGLDDEAKNMLIDKLFVLKEEGKGIVVATHDPRFFSDLFDRHIVL